MRLRTYRIIIIQRIYGSLFCRCQNCSFLVNDGLSKVAVGCNAPKCTIWNYFEVCTTGVKCLKINMNVTWSAKAHSKYGDKCMSAPPNQTSKGKILSLPFLPTFSVMRRFNFSSVFFFFWTGWRRSRQNFLIDAYRTIIIVVNGCSNLNRLKQNEKQKIKKNLKK